MPPPRTAATEIALPLSAGTSGRDPAVEIMQKAPVHSRCDTGAEAAAAQRLSAIRDAARTAAEGIYAAGPGKSVAEAQGENEAGGRQDGGDERRSRKARASYISRFGSAAYTEMLCAHVSSSEREVAALEAQRTELAAESVQLQWAVLCTENAALRRAVVDLGGKLDPCLTVLNR